MPALLAISPQTEPSSPACTLATRYAAERLVHSLAAPIGLWQGGEPWSLAGVWRQEDESQGHTRGSVVFSDCLCDQADHRQAQIANVLATRLTSSTEPRSFPLSTGLRVVAIPLGPQGVDRRPAVLTALADDDTADILCQLAELTLERAEIGEQYDELQADFDVCAAQISDNFEELAFLRSIAQALEATDLTSSLTDMAREVLPNLRTAIKAQEVVLVLTEHNNDRRGAKIVRYEPTHLTDAIFLRILSVYRPGDPGAQIIRNNCGDLVNGLELPDVESFILIPILKSDAVLGWLLAVNRAYRAGFEDAAFQSHLASHEFGSEEAGLMATAASMLASHAYNCEMYRQREELLVKVVRALVSAIEMKDPYTRGHSERVALYARALAKEFGLTDEDCERIYLSGLLHDVGKIGISDATLQKPGKLTKEEYDDIKRHPDLGWDILCELNQLQDVLPGVVHHHEQVNGRGYPDGLVGDDIPIDGRIMAVADAFDAMTSDRPYRKGMPNNKAISILLDGAGDHWDASLVKVFLRIMETAEQIQNTYERPRMPPRTEPVLLP